MSASSSMSSQLVFPTLSTFAARRFRSRRPKACEHPQGMPRVLDVAWRVERLEKEQHLVRALRCLSLSPRTKEMINAVYMSSLWLRTPPFIQVRAFSAASFSAALLPLLRALSLARPVGLSLRGLSRFQLCSQHERDLQQPAQDAAAQC